MLQKEKCIDSLKYVVAPDKPRPVAAPAAVTTRGSGWGSYGDPKGILSRNRGSWVFVGYKNWGIRSEHLTLL